MPTLIYKNFVWPIFFTYLLLFPFFRETKSNQNKNIAFPKAEGYGKFTSGGRGGLVFIVTNLNDSGFGSLRWAVEAKGPRTIVFEVSGNIVLKSRLNVGDGNLTLAGQTAPGEGITIQGFPFRIINKENIIIRYLRFRLGDLSGVVNDAFEAIGGKNLIIDHCSFSWGTDETISVYDFEDATIQNCLISEGLNNSIHEKGLHGYGSLLGGNRISFYRNLMAHFTIRNPSLTSMGTRNGIIDIRNNIVYNWSERTTNNGSNTTTNLINNLFKPGPGTLNSGGHVVNNFLWPTASSGNPGRYGKFFLIGNKLIGRPEIDTNQWLGVRLENSKNTELYLEECKNKDENGILIPFPIPQNLYSNSLTADQAYQQVQKSVGASLFRDSVDSRIIHETITGTYTYKGSKSGLMGIIDSQNDVGGWPKLKNLPALKDTDRDGMPDEWEIKMGLDPEKRSDRFYDLDPDFTNLEVYINGLVAHIIT